MRWQLTTLANSLSVPHSLLSGCPACMENFLSVFCGITCGPDQSTVRIST